MVELDNDDKILIGKVAVERLSTHTHLFRGLTGRELLLLVDDDALAAVGAENNSVLFGPAEFEGSNDALPPSSSLLSFLSLLCFAIA
jgi:hypothetical protein